MCKVYSPCIDWTYPESNHAEWQPPPEWQPPAEWQHQSDWQPPFELQSPEEMLPNSIGIYMMHYQIQFV